MFMGFILHIYIIFGTNQLTGGQPVLLFFCLFRYFEEKEYQMESKRNETFGTDLFGTNENLETWSGSQQQSRRPRGCPAPPRAECAPHPHGTLERPPTYFFLLYISTYPKHPGSQGNTISLAVTFCIREIPSSSIRRRSAGGGIDHGGLLHQHHSPSDEL